LCRQALQLAALVPLPPPVWHCCLFVRNQSINQSKHCLSLWLFFKQQKTHTQNKKAKAKAKKQCH